MKLKQNPSIEKSAKDVNGKHEPQAHQSVPLLKALHILTREGKLNQDSRRKLKQVNHLLQFIEPMIDEIAAQQSEVNIVDHGAGKSYLGFMLYDAFYKPVEGLKRVSGQVIGVETRQDLVQHSQALAVEFSFQGMRFVNTPVDKAAQSLEIPKRVDIVTALHACDTATDDAIRFAINCSAQFIVLVPCCQAEVASTFRQQKKPSNSEAVQELWRHPIHAREFGSHLTNVLRALQLESHGYQVTVTELVGWEHSMKNELIIAKRTPVIEKKKIATKRLDELMNSLGLNTLRPRFFTAMSEA